MRIGPWAEPADWLEGCATPPVHLVLTGARDAAEVAQIRAGGYAAEACLTVGAWPAGGPLPRILEYGPPQPGREVAPGEELYLKRGTPAPDAWRRLARRSAPPPAANPRDIGVLVIATARYRRFFPPLLRSIRRNFLPGHRVTVFLFTDRETAEEPGLRVIRIEHAAWPGMALRRHAIFREHAGLLAGMDHLFYLDADMRVIGTVGEEILGELVAVVHPGFHDQPRERFTYERRAESAAWIGPDEGRRYYCAGVQGGGREPFLAAVRQMAARIDADTARGITAVWHDESHWNRYLIDHPPSVELSPSYCWYPDGRSAEFEGRIAVVPKDAEEMRREE